MPWFKKAVTDAENDAPFGLSEAEQVQRQNFDLTFAMLAKIAKADGAVSKKEVAVINNLMDDVLQLDQARKNYAARVFNQARNDDQQSFNDLVKQYADVNSGHKKLFEWLLDTMLRVCLADGEFNSTEKAMLKDASGIFGISDKKFTQLLGQYQQDFSHYYDLLGCQEGDSWETIEESFTQLKVEYSPERIVEMGLPEEFIALAEAKVRDLQDAFERLKSKLQN